MIGIEKIKVLIVDDSAVVRKILTKEIGADKEIEIVGSAPDPYIARDKIVRLKPDVILLDIEMPRMDGITFLKKLMKSYPIRVIIVSSLAGNNSDAAVKAVEYGALDVVRKPGPSYTVQDMSEQLIEKIKHVAKVPEYKLLRTKENIVNGSKPMRESTKPDSITTTNKIIAVGASTGGTEAIKEVISRLPINTPPVIIVQHMPKYFTKAFAERMDDLCTVKVKEAEEMEILAPGKVLIAPGDIHSEIRRSGAVYHVKLIDGERVNHHKPSIDTLFHSVAKHAGKNSVGVLLTGMGKDGAEGMAEMKKAGAYTIAQNEESCIVFGMPREAIKLNCVDKVAHLNDIASYMISN